MYELTKDFLSKLSDAITAEPRKALVGIEFMGCGSCTGTCKNSCRGDCKGSCQGGCTRSCKGHSR